MAREGRRHRLKSLRNWVKQDQRQTPESKEGLTTEKRQELKRLRREVKVLRREQPGAHALYALFDERYLLRYREKPVVAVLVRHGGHGQYAGHVGASGVQARAYRIAKTVFRRVQDHTSGLTLGAIKEDLGLASVPWTV